MKIKYANNHNDVQVGDKVLVRGFFRKCSGVVIYIPGSDVKNRFLESGDIFKIGIHLDNGKYRAISANLKTGLAHTSLIFISRDSTEPIRTVMEADDPVIWYSSPELFLFYPADELQKVNLQICEILAMASNNLDVDEKVLGDFHGVSVECDESNWIIRGSEVEFKKLGLNILKACMEGKQGVVNKSVYDFEIIYDQFMDQNHKEDIVMIFKMLLFLFTTLALVGIFVRKILEIVGIL